MRARRYRLTWKVTILFCCMMYIAGAIANKGMYIIAYLPESLERVSSTYGADSWGNFFVYILVTYICSKATKVSVDQLRDCFAPGLLAMFVVAQIGCYLNGCCGGIRIEQFTFPVQLLEACFGFALFSYILCSDGNGASGKSYPQILILHGINRFICDCLCASEKDLIFSRAQWLAIISVIVGAVWLRLKNQRSALYE